MTTLHSGHWERFRRRMIETDSTKISDREIMELVLQYIFTRGNLNDLSARLIDKFGNFSNVLNANVSDLVEVEGISKTSAEKILLLPKIINFYNIENTKTFDPKMDTKELCRNLATKYLYGLKTERLYMFCVSKLGKLKKVVLIGQGYDSCSNLDLGQILARATENHSKYVYLAHNHPDGKMVPSDSDIHFTIKLAKIMQLSGIKLADHLIVCGNNCYSFDLDGDHLIEKLINTV